MNVVQFKSIDDFASELRRSATQIVDKIVRLERHHTPQDQDGMQVEVTVWATAIMALEQADYLLEFGLSTGVNRDAYGDQSKDGEKAADAIEQKLREHCDDLGLTVRPGKIEVF
jgi:hypothetical protein